MVNRLSAYIIHNFRAFYLDTYNSWIILKIIKGFVLSVEHF